MLFLFVRTKMVFVEKFIILINIIFSIKANLIEDIINKHGMNLRSFMVWPNATIPFYINPEHFDHEQSLTIMTALSMFSFKTCLKFAPVMSPTSDADHVLAIINPEGQRQCQLISDGHSVFGPHEVVLGYECLHSPLIDMMIMKSLGFPFEHNKADRDLYIEVLLENIELSAIELFTKEPKLPLELRLLPYDVNSVMHFAPRYYSKNGHRTIIFKDHNTIQNRIGLTETDLRKIEIVYGPECLKRDRQEKIELCQSYPGVARRKRDVLDNRRSLRVNPEITAPPEINSFKATNDSLKDLSIDDDIQAILDTAFKISSVMLDIARKKYCNGTKIDITDLNLINKTSDVLGIVDVISKHVKNIEENAINNRTVFCQDSDSYETYLRARCPYDDGSWRCRQTYRSTKSGPVRYSTQNRPTYYQSTKHKSRDINRQFVPFGRSGNETVHELNHTSLNNQSEGANKDEATNPTVRRKRHLEFLIDELNNERKLNPRLGNNDIKEVKTIMKREAQEMSAKLETNKVVKQKIKNERDDVKNLVHDINNATGKENSDNVRRDVEGRRFRQKHARVKNSEEPDESSDSKTVQKKQKRVKKNFELEEGPAKKRQDKKRNDKLKAPKTVTLSKGNKEFYDERKWPTGVVVYVIKKEKNYDIDNMRKRLDEVNSILKKKTCVTLQEISEDEANNYEDYLVIDTSPDYVTGRVGGRQIFGSVELFRGEQHRQHAAMMVMAMLGFYFEVSRLDRDKHIRVHTRHVRPDKLHHFEKIREESTLLLPYDYKSATHPAWQYWRKHGKTGISTVATFKQQDPDGSIMRNLGQNEKLLSDIDIVKINSVYGVNCFNHDRSENSNRQRDE